MALIMSQIYSKWGGVSPFVKVRFNSSLFSPPHSPVQESHLLQQGGSSTVPLLRDSVQQAQICSHRRGRVRDRVNSTIPANSHTRNTAHTIIFFTPPPPHSNQHWSGMNQWLIMYASCEQRVIICVFINDNELFF